MKKIAFCFLIYDIIFHEELWNYFFENMDKQKYNIYIHYKYDKPLKYFENNKLKDCIETNYSGHTLSLATNVMLRNAYNDDANNFKFIMLSGACIPLKSFDFIYKKLTMNEHGYFTTCPQIQCFPNCNPLLDFIEKKHISKSHNWFILNRKLVAELSFDKDEILKSKFKDVNAAEEYFFYTYIKVLGLEKEIVTTMNNEITDATTFTNWEGDGYKYPSYRGLKNYTHISNEELTYILNSNCLFGRKFNVDCLTLYDNTYIDAITTDF